MSETFEHDHITRRLVAALDALPVPEEPTGFAAVARPSLARDPRMFLVVGLLLVLVTTLASPEFQRAAADLGKYIERIVFGQGWIGYYFESAGPNASGRPTLRLVFGSSDSPRGPTTPVIVGEDPNHGGWSPDRERVTVSNDSRLYVGDRSGRLRLVADLGAGYFVLGSGWIGNDKAYALAVQMPTGTAGAGNAAQIPLLVTVDLRTGALERQVLDNLGGPSPDGRWLSRPSRSGQVGAVNCSGFAALYDRVTGETIDVVDGSGRPASLANGGFLSDSRIVVAQCDQVAHMLELYVGAPGARPTLIAVVPITLQYPFVTADDRNDQILVIASGPDAPQSAYVFDPTGRLLRRVPLPRLAPPGNELYGFLSHDGRSLGFTIFEPRRFQEADYATQRAGVVDLVTGQVTYLCDRDCFQLLLR